MRRTSAGLLLYRQGAAGIEIFLIHPGGPYFTKKDEGAWSIPKGEPGEGEDPLAAARREFEEETGCRPEGEFHPLAPVKQKNGKLVMCWALRGECSTPITSNTFTIEWPPRSGRMQEFPEADRAAWFTIAEAKKKIIHAQAALLDELAKSAN